MTERSLTTWTLRYDGWDPEMQPKLESLLALGNGHFVTRGALEEATAGGPHYPGTYLGGGFDRAESDVAGRVVENEDLVNWPNWLVLSFRCEGGDWLDLGRVDVLEHSVQLDLSCGLLSRQTRFRDTDDREFLLETRRFVDMADPHVAAIEWVLTPLDWSGSIEVSSAIDGRVTNTGVERYRRLTGKHHETVERGHLGDDAIHLTARSLQSHLEVAQVVRTRAFRDGAPAPVERQTHTEEDRVSQSLFLACEKNKPIRIEKVLCLYSSRDLAVSEPGVEASEHIRHAPDFAQLLHQHSLAWQRLWHRADLELEVDDGCYAQLVLRLHIFHILQTASCNTIGRDVGIPARGLHGEAYRGHIFWDEIFALPYLHLRLPEVTRSLLLYRYRRLRHARWAAARAGFRGALFPWQSGSDGREESQELHLNPESGRWLPDDTHRQRHVNAAIAYNVWHYFQCTGDMEFMAAYGTELLLEIANLFASMAEYDAGRDRYVIRGVVGPDEFHTQYVDHDSPGLDNNAYTNVMAVWVLQTAQASLDLMADHRRLELQQTLHITDEDLRRWDEVSRRMYLPLGEDGLIHQFEGWEKLEELDWDDLRRRHGDIQRLDRLLEAEDRDINRYKATKQADVLMLFFLFSSEQLGELFERLGYDFDPSCIPHNVRYYLRRTSHGSTLSRVVHAWVLSRTDREHSWNLFQDSLASDIDDVQGGTTAEGIHLGAMTGTVDLMQRCYTGVEIRTDALWLNPRLPRELTTLQYRLRYRGHTLSLRLDHTQMTVRFEKGCWPPARIGFAGRVHEMAPGEEKHFALAKGHTP